MVAIIKQLNEYPMAAIRLPNALKLKDLPRKYIEIEVRSTWRKMV